MIAEARFRRLDAPVLLAEVAERAVYDDGERLRSQTAEVTVSPYSHALWARHELMPCACYEATIEHGAVPPQQARAKQFRCSTPTRLYIPR